WEDIDLRNNLRNGSEIRKTAKTHLADFLDHGELVEQIFRIDENREGRNQAEEKEIQREEVVQRLRGILENVEEPDSTLILTSDSKDWLDGKGKSGIFPIGARDQLRQEFHHPFEVDTVLRVKGLEARTVIAFILDTRNAPEEWKRKRAHQLAYMAATRATHELFLFWVT
ncbi:MAG: hypothetical protein EBX52_08215, partial [Proteobacteria bacterium]|nr:hypothetical protein [Pseudomonadota bacterium]